MKCSKTEEFVMYIHCDDLDHHIGFATCSTINGNYELQDLLLFNGDHQKLSRGFYMCKFKRAFKGLLKGF